MDAELIDHTTLAWSHQLIAQHFHVDDIPIILSIPIRADSEDFIAWHFHDKGQFSIKSVVRQEGQGSNSLPIKQEVF
jgi:hypothetical protein